MSFKIPCGGFKLDEKSFSLDENGVLSVSGGGGGVQPDWNQNDSTAADYIKNRPFYTGNPVETVLVEKNALSFIEEGGLYVAFFRSDFEATVGETYNVSWDGTIYECVCVNFRNSLIIGNLSIRGAGSDTGEPFLMLIDNGSGIAIYTKDASASHTIFISGIVEPIVKIPAKFIDKNTSGYIVVHESKTMTEQEAENYKSAMERTKIVFIKWFDLNISDIGVARGTNTTLSLQTINNEKYEIGLNNDGLFNFDDKSFVYVGLPDNPDSIPYISVNKNTKRVTIDQNLTISGEGTTDILFRVNSNGTKSKNFDVLGNGEAVAPAIILYSTTANSTKKFRVTVDDSGNLTATEI